MSQIRKKVCDWSKCGEHWSNGNFQALCIFHRQWGSTFRANLPRQVWWCCWMFNNWLGVTGGEALIWSVHHFRWCKYSPLGQFHTLSMNKHLAPTS